jgi:hypothetical protein
MKSIHIQPAGQNKFTNDQYSLIVSAFHQSLLRKSRAERRKSAPAAKIGGGRAKAKIHYPTLAEALQARSSMARKRGRRCKRLRPYQVRGEWFLTKMTKGQVRSFAGGRQSAYGW